MPCKNDNPLGRHYTRFLAHYPQILIGSPLHDRSLQRKTPVCRRAINRQKSFFSDSTVEVGLTRSPLREAFQRVRTAPADCPQPLFPLSLTAVAAYPGQITLRSRSAEISSPRYPRLARTSSVCSPSCGPTQPTSPGVSESLGTTPGTFNSVPSRRFTL